MERETIVNRFGNPKGFQGGVSIAMVLMVAIYSLGGISGGNFNPGVSVALGVSNAMGGPGMDWKTDACLCLPGSKIRYCKMIQVMRRV